jgi:hypothetical protein
MQKVTNLIVRRDFRHFRQGAAAPKTVTFINFEGDIDAVRRHPGFIPTL